MRIAIQPRFLPAILLWSQAVLLTVSAAPQVFPFVPSLLPHHLLQHRRDDRTPLTKLRDGIIKAMWRLPSTRAFRAPSGTPQSVSAPPSKLLARYGGDVVLRFKIRSAEEAKALSEAVNILFLDVWEFTREWADIRLANDVVC